MHDETFAVGADVDSRHQLERGVEVEDPPTARVPCGEGDVGAERGRGEEQGDLRRVAAGLSRVGGVDLCAVARRHRSRQLLQRRAGRGLARWLGTPSSHASSTAPAEVQMPVTRIRFSVRVPVLSVQITVVEPNVSTALSRLTKRPAERARAPRPPGRA